MKLRVRFLWPDPKDAADRKFLGLGLITRLVSAEGDLLTVWVNTRAVLKVTCALVALAWLAGAGGLHYRLSRNPYNRVAFADLLLPTRWSHLRDLRGQTYLAEARADVAASRIGPAVMKFRAGLERHPDDPAARLTLAKIYADARDYPDLRHLLLPRAGAPPPSREMLAFLLTAAAQNDDLSTIVEACDLALGNPVVSPADRAWLRTQKAGALLAWQRFPETLATLGPPAALTAADDRRLAVLALCETGRAAEAVELLRTWPFSANHRPLQWRLLALALRRAGRLDEMDASLRTLIATDSPALEPRLIAVEEYTRAGWKDTAARTMQDCLDRFDTDPAAMARLVQFGSDLGDPDLLRLCVENLDERGQSTAIARAGLFFACATRGNTVDAERALAPSTDDHLDPASTHLLRALLGCLKESSPEAAVPLRTALAAGRFTLRTYLDAASALSRLQRWSAVEDTVAAGLAIFPASRRLAEARNAAREKLADATYASRAAAASRAPATTAPVIGAIGPFLDELEQTMAGQDWDRAIALIAAARSAAPAWLAQLEADLTWREARIAFEKDNVDRVVFFLGERVRVRPREASRALGFVREYRSRGDIEAARRLVARIVREAPDFAPARELLAELTPPPPK